MIPGLGIEEAAQEPNHQEQKVVEDERVGQKPLESLKEKKFHAKQNLKKKKKAQNNKVNTYLLETCKVL